MRPHRNSELALRSDFRPVVPGEREALRRYHDLVDSIDGIVWESDAKTFNFLFVSKRAERLLGYPIECWYQPGFWKNHIHPKDRERACAYCVASTQAQIPHEFEYRMIAADGRTVWLRDIVTVISEFGSPSILRGIMVDITAQKVLEEALSESEMRFRALSESGILGISVSDFKSGQMIEANDKLLNLLGFNRDELKAGRVHWDTLTAPESRDRDQEAIRQLQSQGSISPYEKYFIRRDGKRICLLIAGTYLKGNLMVGYAVDVSERHRLMDEMREANMRASFMAEFSKELTRTLDAREVLRFATQSLKKNFCDWCLFCLTQELTQNQQNCCDSVSFSFKVDPQINKGVYQVMNTGQSLLIHQVDQPLKIVEDLGLSRISEANQLNDLVSQSSIVVPMIAFGKIRGAVILVSTRKDRLYSERDLPFFEDLALRICLAIENCSLYQQSQQAIEARNEFLSIASHELRTPITALRLQLELLKQTMTEAENLRVKRNLEVAEQQVLRLTDLVGDLLDVSRIRAGRLLLQCESTNIESLVTHVIERYRFDMTKVGTTIDFQSAGPVIGVWDPIRIEQVVENLLSNAIKYGLGKPVIVKVMSRGNVAYLIVKDHGIGIEKESQDRIFSRFERAVSSKKYSGLGLGLYIVRQIVEAHQGKIRVKSIPQKGSTFIVELPI